MRPSKLTQVRIQKGPGAFVDAMPPRFVANLGVVTVSEAKPAPLRRSHYGGKPLSSQYRGVQSYKNGLYTANVYVEGRRLYLGHWPSEREAAIARDQAILHLERSDPLNFPEEATKLGPASPIELRLAARRTVKQSRNSTSRYLGVSWNNADSCWKAHVTTREGCYEHIGSFHDEREAAMARDRVALYEHKSKVILNFPPKEVSAASLERMRIRARQLAMRDKETTSAYRGVYRPNARSLWQAAYGSRGDQLRLGRWPTEREAAQAHDRALLYYGGDIALLNFPRARHNLRPTPAKDLRREAHECFKRMTHSKFRGVTLARSGRWVASIQAEHASYHLGTFDDEEDAAKSYDRAARRLHGAKAKLNFPKSRGKRGKVA